MNKRIFASVAIFTLIFNLLDAQNIVEYSYDENGNRTDRTLTITQLKRVVADFPIDMSKLELSKPEDLNSSILIYPNPVRSTMNISISGYDNARKRSVFVYGITGRIYYRNEKTGNSTDVDLDFLEDGIYILRIVIDNEVFDYKIIKSK